MGNLPPLCSSNPSRSVLLWDVSLSWTLTVLRCLERSPLSCPPLRNNAALSRDLNAIVTTGDKMNCIGPSWDPVYSFISFALTTASSVCHLSRLNTFLLHDCKYVYDEDKTRGRKH